MPRFIIVDEPEVVPDVSRSSLVDIAEASAEEIYGQYFAGADYINTNPSRLSSYPLHISRLNYSTCVICGYSIIANPGIPAESLTNISFPASNDGTLNVCTGCQISNGMVNCAGCQVSIPNSYNVAYGIYSGNYYSNMSRRTVHYCYRCLQGNISLCNECGVRYLPTDRESIEAVIDIIHPTYEAIMEEYYGENHATDLDYSQFAGDEFFEAVINSDSEPIITINDSIERVLELIIEHQDGLCYECGIAQVANGCGYNSATRHRRNRYDNAGFIHDYNYKPDPIFHCENDEVDNDQTLYFGVELETEMRSNHRGQSEAVASALLKNVGPFIYCKYDGSLSNGFEIVSHPATYKHWKNNTKYMSGIDRLSKYCRSFRADSCGIHIHMNKSAFSGLHLARFLHFMYNNPSFVEFIAQRTSCTYANFLPEERNSVLARGKNKSGNYERYAVVNLQPEETIEIRIFKGNLRPDAFLKNIEFCKALYDFTNPDQLDGWNVRYEQQLDRYINGNMMEFNQLMSNEFNLGKFIEYIDANKEEYNNLYLRLKEGNKVVEGDIG